jgi:hypothetical protein
MMKSNIGRSGRIARGISGLIFIVAGIVTWLAHWPESLAWRWIVVVVLIGAGGFQLFEARRGWCVTRACGIKTPM